MDEINKKNGGLTLTSFILRAGFGTRPAKMKKRFL
jgi:hypothetical protein